MNFKKIKRSLAVLTVVSMFSTMGVAMPAKADTTGSYNYAKALQLSLYLYDANQCGKVSEGNERLTYRDDCHLADASVPLIPKGSGKGTNLSASFISANKAALDPDGNGSVDLSGGYHDCGDHVKFGITQGYSGATLGWGYYEFKDSYAKIGEQDHIEDILRWFNDYFMKCTFRDANGNVVAFAYQVGDGGSDHGYWGTPEAQTTDRPAWFASSETPASDQCAEAAASLAVNYLNFKDSDLTYANKCLDTAKALYKFAKNNRGIGYSGGFYNSSYDEDDMSWAAVWLNKATKDSSYLNDAIATDSSGNYTGYLKKTISNKTWKYHNSWVHCWDNVWAGVYGVLATTTNDSAYWDEFRWNAEYWSGVNHQDNSSGYIGKTPGGYSFLNQWGSARYNTAAQLCTLVYNKYKPIAGFQTWAKSQMDYILGKNPLNRCYEVGYDSNSVKYPHHRASHGGSPTNSLENPVESKHVLYGALVGGPDGSDNHTDVRKEYVENEVGIDYNAGFVGALAALYEVYGQGQQPMTNIPETKNVAKTDSQAPTAPSNLTCDSKTASSVSLSWTASTDNVAVTKYDIYNGSTLVGTSTTPKYTVTGLSANTTYSFTVKAKDDASNVSQASSALSVTTTFGALKGDVNSDNKVNIVDYMVLQKYVKNKNSVTINTTNADINGDTKVTIADLLALRKIIVNS